MENKVNIIGIKDSGKRIIDNIDADKLNDLLTDANNATFKPITGPYYNNKYSVNKYYFNDIFDAIDIDDNYYTFTVVDGLGYSGSYESYKPKDNSESILHICLSINSNIVSTKYLKTINVNDKDVLDVLLNLIHLVIPTPKFIDYDLIDFYLFFEEKYYYKTIVVKGNNYNDLVDKYIIELKKVNNLEEVFSMINISDYSIAKLNYLIDKVKEANICSTGGFSSVTDNKTLENNTIVAICKVKEEIKYGNNDVLLK